MSDVKKVKKLNRTDLNRLAEVKGITAPESYETKGELAEMIADTVTDEELANATGSTGDVNAPTNDVPTENTQTTNSEPNDAQMSQNDTKTTKKVGLTYRTNDFIKVRFHGKEKQAQVVRTKGDQVHVTVDGNPEVFSVNRKDVIS